MVRRKHRTQYLLSGILFVPLYAILAFAQGNPSSPADTTMKASYAGSDACKLCHGKTYDSWATSPHGKALTQGNLPAELTGCEACHGPGSVHIGSGAQNKPSVPKADDPQGVIATCGACHFSNDVSKVPKEWQNLSSSNFARSTHGRKGLSCISCHSGHPNGNDHALLRPEGELCLGCHASVLEESPGKKADYTHSPVASGQCASCHNPHVASDPRMIVDNLQKVCMGCHDTKDAKLVTAHSGYSVADSKCTSCHDPHSHNRKGKLLLANQHPPFQQRNCQVCHTKPEAGTPVQLVKPVKDLCFSCHPASKLMPEGENAHVPAKEGLCLSCHNPHASPYKKMLKTKLAYACFSCHTKVESSTVEAHRHQILDANLNCTLCHKPHSSPQEKLLVKEQPALCGQCHRHKFSHPIGTREDGTPVVDPNTGKALVCGSCHDPHGSKFAMLTRANKDRDLCIRCHKELK